MKRFFRFGLGICATVSFVLFSHISLAASSVPDEFYANYKIQGKWTQMIELLENIEASVRVGSDPAAGTFGELHRLFTIIFPYFPKSPSNNVIYKQCDLTAKELATEITPYKYTLFKERCFTPIGQIVQQIESKYTVKPAISVKPQQ